MELRQLRLWSNKELRVRCRNPNLLRTLCILMKDFYLLLWQSLQQIQTLTREFTWMARSVWSQNWLNKSLRPTLSQTLVSVHNIALRFRSHSAKGHVEKWMKTPIVKMLLPKTLTLYSLIKTECELIAGITIGHKGWGTKWDIFLPKRE